jgi:hypothetical protein
LAQLGQSLPYEGRQLSKAKRPFSELQHPPRLGSKSGKRETLLSLNRFRSTAGDPLVSLADYVGRMKPGQEDPADFERIVEGLRKAGLPV